MIYFLSNLIDVKEFSVGGMLSWGPVSRCSSLPELLSSSELSVQLWRKAVREKVMTEDWFWRCVACSITFKAVLTSCNYGSWQIYLIRKSKYVLNQSDFIVYCNTDTNIFRNSCIQYRIIILSLFCFIFASYILAVIWKAGFLVPLTWWYKVLTRYKNIISLWW